jgi:hypothetical protein
MTPEAQCSNEAELYQLSVRNQTADFISNENGFR